MLEAANPTKPSAEPGESRRARSGVLRAIGDFLRLLVIAAAIAIPIRYFIAQPFIVRGASMEPNYEDREYLIVDELSYFVRSPERGEVIVFRAPVNTSEYFIKRVIGLPGETVEIRDGAIRISNNERPEGFNLTEPYLPPELKTPGNAHFTLGADEFVVLGDNRIASSDSRSWGVLERKKITGKVIFRAWPPSAFGVIREP